MQLTDSHPIRPCWAPGVPIIRLADGRVRIGSDPDKSVCLEHCDEPLFTWLAQLDGRCSAANQLLLARSAGIEAAVASEMLDVLIALALLVDGIPHQGLLDALPDGALAVVGQGAIVKGLLDFIPARLVKIHEVDRRDAYVDLDLRGALLAVLVMRRAVPDRTELAISDSISMQDVPYVPVGVGSADMRLGPLVIPGQSACLRCEDEVRAGLDPQWRELSLHLALEPTPLVDDLAARWLAAELSRYLREFCGQLGFGHQFELRHAGAGLTASSGIREACADGGPWRYRTLERHPLCGCCWAQ